MADYAGNMPAENETMSALRAYFSAAPTRRATTTMPFSSTLKYGGMSFHEDESYLLGAPERILQSQYYKYRDAIEGQSAQGYRVLLLALYDGEIGEKPDASAVMPLALIMLSNHIREGAPATFRFFAEQGVKIIVISGDNPLTVSQIAKEAGIDGAERYVDAAELSTDKKLKRAVGEYVVFGRVTPDQKRKLIRAFKAAGHTVAMTGDGVNDVLALKDANCSIAMASGSEVATQVSDIVLLDSDFAAMPSVVMEGRRVINNIERTAALYLMKNIFSFLFAIVVIAIALPYPLSTSQITLYSIMMIGIPSFFLALEPNKKIVKGKFIFNVLRSALPAGLTDFFALIALVIVCSEMGIPVEEMGTMACIVVSFVGLLMLYKLCMPPSKLRIALIGTMAAGFVLGATLLSGLFAMAALSWSGIWVTAAFCVAAAPVMLAFSLAFGTLRLSDFARKQPR
jgi:cation-transporting ATPase E